MRRQADLSEAVLLSGNERPDADRCAADVSAQAAGAAERSAAAPWPREPLSPQRLREAEVAQAQAALKRELVRVYALSCGASRAKE